MSLDRLVEEVRRRGDEELQAEGERLAAEARRLVEDRARRLRELDESAHRAEELEVVRVRSAILARAKSEARRVVFAARQAETERRRAGARDNLREFAGSTDYASVMKRLYAYALRRLGASIKLAGRSDDQRLLRSLAGAGNVLDPVPILGGFVAETPDGSRRLDLSFDELLRRQEDELIAAGREGPAGPA